MNTNESIMNVNWYANWTEQNPAKQPIDEIMRIRSSGGDWQAFKEKVDSAFDFLEDGFFALAPKMITEGTYEFEVEGQTYRYIEDANGTVRIFNIAT